MVKPARNSRSFCLGLLDLLLGLPVHQSLAVSGGWLFVSGSLNMFLLCFPLFDLLGLHLRLLGNRSLPDDERARLEKV